MQHEPANMHDSVAVLYMMTFAQIPFELWVGEGSTLGSLRPRVLPHQRQLQLHGGSASWCKHVGSLAYVLVEDCEIKPLAFLKGLGIDLHARHSRGITPAQEKALRKRHGSGSFRPCDSDDFGEEILHLWFGVVAWH